MLSQTIICCDMDVFGAECAAGAQAGVKYAAGSPESHIPVRVDKMGGMG